MKSYLPSRILLIATLSFFLGIASVAMAVDTPKDATGTRQMTTSPHQMEMHGMNKMHRGNGMTMGSDTLTEEQIQKLKAEKAAFQKDTRDLRLELKSKSLALQSELVKKEPDAKTAKSLQKEISSLNAELAQKRIEHFLEIKKIAPYAGMKQLLDGRGFSKRVADQGHM